MRDRLKTFQNNKAHLDLNVRLLLSIIVALISVVPAATYHFSSTSGDDSRSSLQAQSVTTPWRTMHKVKGLQLSAGDSVLFECGSTFIGTLALGQAATVSGSAGKPVCIASYGSGPLPIITGSQPVTGPWTKYQGNIWSTSVTDSVEQLFLNGKTLTLARFPNQGTVPVTTITSDNVFQCAGLTGMTLQGATIFARSEHWSWNMNVITQFNAANGSVTIGGKPIYVLKSGWGAWVNNHLSLLDAPGEWYWDSGAHLLYVWLPDGGTPNGKSLEASRPGPGVDIATLRFTVMQDLILKNHGGDGIIGNANDFTMRRLRIENPLASGIKLNGQGITVDQSEIIGPNVYGMEIYCDGAQITGNTVKGVAELRRLTRTGLGGQCCSGRGINVEGADIVVRNNTLDSIGYIGIGFNGARNHIENNVVRHHCMTTDDCAGIYTWSPDFVLPGSAGSVIRGNLVLDGVGAPDGIPDHSTFALGIYLDDRTHQVTIENNSVSGTDIGLYMHNNRDDTVRNNLSYGNRLGQLITQRDEIVGANDMYGNVVRANTLYSTSKNGAPYSERLYRANASPLLAVHQDDLECRESPFGIRCERNGILVWERTLQLQPQDTAGRAVYTFNFSSNLQNWSAWPTPPVAVTYDAAEHGGSLRLDYPGDSSSNTPLLYAAKSFPVKLGERYLLKFSARASAAFDLGILPRKANPNYAELGSTAHFRIGTTWDNFIDPFEISASDSTCRLDFIWGQSQAHYWIDDLTLYPLPAADPTIGPSSAFYYNVNATNLTVNPNPGSSWLDVNGVVQNSAVSLSPLGAFIAIRDKSNLLTVLDGRAPNPSTHSLQPRLRRMQAKMLFSPGKSSKPEWRNALGRIPDRPLTQF